MERDQALIAYQNEIAGYLGDGKRRLFNQFESMRPDLEKQLQERLECICKAVKRPVVYFQISLLQCLIGQDIYRIMVSAHDETYFLDSDMYVDFFDINPLFDGNEALKEKLYDIAGYYHGAIQMDTVDKFLVKMAMNFFKGIGGELRGFFRDFDQWDSIRSLPDSPRLVVKWGEHREFSETIFLISRQAKTQEQFMDKNEKNELHVWNSQYIYQGWDMADMKDFSLCKKNFMFLSMRGCRLTNISWANCLFYGAAFRQAKLEHVAFLNCDLSKCDFRKTELMDVGFLHCKLDGSDFTGAQLQEVNFTDSTVEGVLFDGGETLCIS